MRIPRALPALVPDYLLSGETFMVSCDPPVMAVYRIVPRDGKNSGTVGHDDVFSLTYDTKSGSLQGAYSRQVVYPRDFAHGSIPRLLSLGVPHQGIDRLRPPSTRGSRRFSSPWLLPRYFPVLLLLVFLSHRENFFGDWLLNCG